MRYPAHACVVALALVLTMLAQADTSGGTTWLDDWHDAKRHTTVPVKVYEPTGDGPFPVIIFSHGLGGSRNGYKYLGEHWASHGYVSVHLQHIGSDDSVWKDAERSEVMRNATQAIRDPKNIINRPLDVSFAIDTLEQLNANGPRLKGKLDLKNIGMAGHSFGAYTTLAIAGQSFPTAAAKLIDVADPRVKAAVALSSPVPVNNRRVNDAYATIAIPVLHMTGTKDASRIGDTAVEDRRVPFDHTPGGPGREQYLIIFKDGDHMVFSGQRRGPKSDTDPLYHKLIQQSSTTFWDAYLRGDAKAKTFLLDGELKKTLDKSATLELKR